MQVKFPGAAKDFLPRVSFQCRLFFGVRTPPCAVACINICGHGKDPVVHVRVRWFRRIMASQTYPARTISGKNNQLDGCGRSSAMSMLLQLGYICALLSLSSSSSSSSRRRTAENSKLKKKKRKKKLLSYKSVLSNLLVLVVKSSVVPQRPSRLRDRWWWWYFDPIMIRRGGEQNKQNKYNAPGKRPEIQLCTTLTRRLK